MSDVTPILSALEQGDPFAAEQFLPHKPSTRLSDSGEALRSISPQRHMEPAKPAKRVRGEFFPIRPFTVGQRAVL